MLRYHQETLLVIAVAFSGSLCPTWAPAGETAETAVRRIADSILVDATFRFVDRKSGRVYASTADAPQDAELQPESRYTDWRYWNGVLDIAMIKLGDVLHDARYRKFAVRQVAFCFDNVGYFEKRHKDENKWSYPFGEMFTMEELDDYGAMGAGVVEIYGTDPQERYREYLKRGADYIEGRQSRLTDGTLVRSFPLKWTLWADDLYMSVSFLSRMGSLTGDRRYFDDAARQVVNFHHYLLDPSKGIFYHNWYSDRDRDGVAFWGRANGWALMAQVDLMDRLPANHPARDTLLSLLRRHILGITRYQGGNGLWRQLLNKVDSYEETSCSAMFTYAIAHAVNKGYIEPGFASVARRGWEGIQTRIGPDGKIGGICEGTVVSDDLVYYYRRPTPTNDVHGIGAVLLAGAEILQLPRE